MVFSNMNHQLHGRKKQQKSTVCVRLPQTLRMPRARATRCAHGTAASGQGDFGFAGRFPPFRAKLSMQRGSARLGAKARLQDKRAISI